MRHQKLQELELLRQKAAKTYGICVLACIVLPAIIGLLAGFLSGNFVVGISLGITIFMFTLFMSLFYYGRMSKPFKAAFSQTIFKEVLSELVELKHFIPGEGFNADEVHGFIDLGDKYNGDNYIEADYKGVFLRYAHAYSSTTTYDSENNSSTTVHFSGVFYMFRFPSDFAVVCLKDRKGKFGLKLPFDEMKLNYADIAARFKIYTDDHIKAEKLFNGSFCGFVSDIAQQIERGVNIYIKGDCMYLAINSQGHFGLYKPNVFKKIDDTTYDDAAVKIGKLLTIPDIFIKHFGGVKE